MRNNNIESAMFLIAGGLILGVVLLFSSCEKIDSQGEVSFINLSPDSVSVCSDNGSGFTLAPGGDITRTDMSSCPMLGYKYRVYSIKNDTLSYKYTKICESNNIIK